MPGRGVIALAMLIVIFLLVSGCGEKTRSGEQLPVPGPGLSPAPDPEGDTRETEYVIYLNSSPAQTEGPEKA